jgi:hypothetical protein
VDFAFWKKLARGVSLKRDLEEIRALVLSYIKSETVTPLRELGRFVLWGSVGSLFVGTGVLFLGIGVLRFAQHEFPVLNGSLSWIPYLILAFFGVISMTLAVIGVSRGNAKRRQVAKK